MQETANSGFFFLAPWLVFAPVVGLWVNLIFGSWFAKQTWGETAIGVVASLASGAAFVVSVLLAYSVAAADGEMASTVVDWDRPRSGRDTCAVTTSACRGTASLAGSTRTEYARPASNGNLG